MNWADLNPIQRPKKPAGTGKVYVGLDVDQPHAGLAVFSDTKIPGSFCVEGSAARLKAELCGKIIDWDKVPAKFPESLKAGASLTITIDRLKSFIR